MKKKRRKKSKLNMLSAVYIIMSVFVCVLSVFSFTFAWYIKTNTESLNFTFAKPIVVDLTSSVRMDELAVGTPDAVMPGDKLYVNIGVRMSDSSSPAYVRAKLNVDFDDVYDENNQLVSWDGMLSGVEQGFVTNDVVSEDWVLVNFSRSDTPDYWFVLKLRGSTNVARQLSESEVVTFANSTINVSLKLDNRFAEKKITFSFSVETIQVNGISDPIAFGSRHDQWGHE